MPRATPWEHLRLSAKPRRLGPGWEGRARDLLERFELGDVTHRVTSGVSRGMGRLSVVLAALHDSAVLPLHEPFDGVDPIGVEATLRTIDDARARGACVLVSTHLRELAIEACSSVLAAAPLRGWSRWRLLSARDQWVDPVVRARVVMTVTG